MYTVLFLILILSQNSDCDKVVVKVRKMEMRIAICDDEKIMIDCIRSRLIQHNPSWEIDQYLSGKQLLGTEKEYDLIFLDIEMPDMNGMEVAMELRNREFDGHLVFLTSHSEFMPTAFKVKAFRFLKKPIEDVAFEETLIESEKEIYRNKKIIINTSESTKVVKLKDIICLEIVRNSTYMHTKDGQIVTRRTLREWMEILGDEYFLQVHKSYVVALRYIDTINTNVITMKDMDMKIPISRRKSKEVRNAFFSFIKKHALSI